MAPANAWSVSHDVHDLMLTVEERIKDILSGRGIPREKIPLMNLPDDRIFYSVEGDRTGAGKGFVLVYHGTLTRRLGLDIAIRRWCGSWRRCRTSSCGSSVPERSARDLSRCEITWAPGASWRSAGVSCQWRISRRGFRTRMSASCH